MNTHASALPGTSNNLSNSTIDLPNDAKIIIQSFIDKRVIRWKSFHWELFGYPFPHIGWYCIAPFNVTHVDYYWVGLRGQIEPGICMIYSDQMEYYEC